MSQPPLRLVFAGTPDFAVPHLQALIASKHQLLGVYTQPDRPAGRGRNLRAGPVKQAALDAGVPVLQPPSLKDPGVQAHLAELAAEVMVVVAYGLILPPAVLSIPRRGCINVHASLLPRWRGAAPVQRAIEAGDAETGVSIMQMDAGLDTGDVLASASCPVGNHSAATLQRELARLGPPLLLEVLADLAHYQGRACAQEEAAATYAHKIDKAEGLIDWNLDALTLERRVRAFDPAPGCYTFLDGQRIKIWEARSVTGPPAAQLPGTIVRSDEHGITVQCGDGLLSVSALQLSGSRRMNAGEVLRARRDLFAPGRRFSAAAPDGG
ncbi:MAG: methionyl-tRNA formyltransferase [Halioglobus sp.]|nr:methionyl-tRNA formyltransferase [Halioglobus sp.]